MGLSIQLIPYPFLYSLAFLIMIAGRSGAQDLLINGSFEEPPVASNAFLKAPLDSWKWDNSMGFVFGAEVGGIWPVPSDGQQYVDIGNQPIYSLSQTFTVTEGGEYELKWAENTAANRPPGFQSSPYSVIIEGSSEPRHTFDAFNNGNWECHSLSLDLAEGNYTLRFTAEGVFNSTDTLLDSVTLTPVALFIRGDSTEDGKVDITDAVRTLHYLFVDDNPMPVCLDAVDDNDDGKLDISDAVYLLAYLFQGGPSPPAPGPATCGADDTEDSLPPCGYDPGQCPK